MPPGSSSVTRLHPLVDPGAPPIAVPTRSPSEAVLVTDLAGNAVAAGTVGTFTVALGELTTSVTVSSSQPTSTYGQSVTFTATVANTSGSGGVPTGSVEFFDGSTDLGPGSSLSGSGTTAISTFSITTLAAGSHLIKAVYTATGNFDGNSGTVSQTVNRAVLTVSGITAANKVYNANTTATLNTSGATLVGVFSGDTVTLQYQRRHRDLRIAERGDRHHGDGSRADDQRGPGRRLHADAADDDGEHHGGWSDGLGHHGREQGVQCQHDRHAQYVGRDAGGRVQR